jgi:hypothetical protein
MTTQQTPNKPHLEMTVTDFHTLHTALDLAMANTWVAVGQFTESGDTHAARAASVAFADTKMLHDRLFQAAHAASSNSEQPFGELPAGNHELTLMVSTLVALKGSANASLNSEHAATHTAQELEHMRQLAADADNLAKRLAAFVREHDPKYAAEAAQRLTIADGSELPGWDDPANALGRATFEEFAQLIGGDGPALQSTRLQ